MSSFSLLVESLLVVISRAGGSTSLCTSAILASMMLSDLIELWLMCGVAWESRCACSWSSAARERDYSARSSASSTSEIASGAGARKALARAVLVARFARRERSEIHPAQEETQRVESTEPYRSAVEPFRTRSNHSAGSRPNCSACKITVQGEVLSAQARSQVVPRDYSARHRTQNTACERSEYVNGSRISRLFRVHDTR